MICGLKLKIFYLSSALLLLVPAVSYSEEYYKITAEELTKLETTLTEQKETLEKQSATLKRQENTIELQSETIERLKSRIETQEKITIRLSTSLEEYEREAREEKIKIGILGFAGGFLTGSIAVLALTR